MCSALAVGQLRAFVGIDCDVPEHRLGSTMSSYRGAYVSYGLPGETHMRRVFNTGDPELDFNAAFYYAAGVTTNVYVSGTAEFFAQRSAGLFEFTGLRISRIGRRIYAA